MNGTKVTTEINFRLRRVTRTNKICTGAAMLRYAKNKPLPPENGAWQSAFLFGCLGALGLEAMAEPERKLCITIDAYSATIFPAPSDSVSRFREMEAACATIAERWQNIEPPAGAILEE
jgi:hypothetical protein